MRRPLLPAALVLLLLAACSVGVEGAPCQTDANCPEGQACGADRHCASGARCPAAGPAEGQACATASALACPGTVRLRCTPVASMAACDVWVREEDCGASGLACKADATSCACPAAGPTFYADAGAPAPPAGLVRTGAQTPSSCRFNKFGDALNAANAVGAGGGVRLVGWTGGSKMVFAEPGPLTVSRGVSVSTDDPGPVMARYALVAPATGALPFLSLASGSQISRVEVANAGSTSAGIVTACPAPADAQPVTIDSVVVTGTSGWTVPTRFTNGVKHTGYCPLVVNGTAISGASDGGVFVAVAAPSASLTMTGNLIQRNLATTPYTIGPPPDRTGGGVVFAGTLPAAVVFRGNTILSNAGDQVLVFAAGSLDLSASACDATANVIACYGGAGVGVSTKAATVNVAHTHWNGAIPMSGTDYVVDVGATVVGATQSCAAYALTCP